MTSFYYYDQNPSGFCFLVQIRAFVIQTSLGLQNLNMKGKTKRIPVVVVKWRHRANGLFVPMSLNKQNFAISTWRIRVFKSEKKNLWIQKYPDTCGWGLSLVFNATVRFWNSETASVYKPLVRPENVQTEDMIDITPIPTALLAFHGKYSKIEAYFVNFRAVLDSFGTTCKLQRYKKVRVLMLETHQSAWKRADLLIYKIKHQQIKVISRGNWTMQDITLSCIQLFRESLSDKVHATNPKGIVGGFKVHCFSKKFERMARQAMDIHLLLII